MSNRIGTGKQLRDDEPKDAPPRKKQRTETVPKESPEMSSNGHESSSDRYVVLWNALPPKLQHQIVLWMDVKTRCRLAQCSTHLAKIAYEVHLNEDLENAIEEDGPFPFRTSGASWIWMENQCEKLPSVSYYNEKYDASLSAEQVQRIEQIGWNASSRFPIMRLNVPNRYIMEGIRKSSAWKQGCISGQYRPETWKQVCRDIRGIGLARDGTRRTLSWSAEYQQTKDDAVLLKESLAESTVDLKEVHMEDHEDPAVILEGVGSATTVEHIYIKNWGGDNPEISPILKSIGANFPKLSSFAFRRSIPFGLDADLWKTFVDSHPDLSDLTLNPLVPSLRGENVDFSLLKAKKVSLDLWAEDPDNRIGQWIAGSSSVQTLELSMDYVQFYEDDFYPVSGQVKGTDDQNRETVERRFKTLDIWLQSLAQNQSLQTLKLSGLHWIFYRDQTRIRPEFLNLLKAIGENKILKNFSIDIGFHFGAWGKFSWARVPDSLDGEYISYDDPGVFCQPIPPNHKLLYQHLEVLEQMRPDLHFKTYGRSFGGMKIGAAYKSRQYERMLGLPAYATNLGDEDQINVDWCLPAWGNGVVREFYKIFSMDIQQRGSYLFDLSLPVQGDGLSRTMTVNYARPPQPANNVEWVTANL
jgi:hypothetical protein